MIHRTLLSLLIAVCCFGWLTVSAEVSRTEIGPGSSTIVMGLITEGPDPVGIWLPRGNTNPSLVLNASGDFRDDAAPDIAYRENGWPVAVWGYNAGTDFDVAVAEWDGTAWTSTEFLTSSAASEQNPRVFVEPNGAIHVVWWVPEAEEVYLATRAAGSSIWGAPVNVTDHADFDKGRRPTVIKTGGTLYVAYERTPPEGSPGIGQEVVVATHDGGSGFTQGFLGGSARLAPLVPVLHFEHGKLWLDWFQTDDEIGSKEKVDAQWVNNPKEPLTDSSWIGVEDTRRSVRNQVLAE